MLLPWPASVWIAIAFGFVASVLVLWATGACVWRLGRASPTLHRILVFALAPSL